MLGRVPRDDPAADSAKETDALDALITKTAALYSAGVCEVTRKTYARRWDLFEAWCESNRLPHLPASAETVMLYLTQAVDAENGAALSTLRGWNAAINRVHVEAGIVPPGDDPAMRMFLRALSRRVGSGRISEQISALRIADLRRLCRALDDMAYDPIEVRDRALLALHRAGVGDGQMGRLRWTDVAIEGPTAVLTLRSPRADRVDTHLRLDSHSDVRFCAVDALRSWKRIAGTGVPWVFTLTDVHGTRVDKEWDSRAIRRIRLARTDSFGTDGCPAAVDAAIAMLGATPSAVLRDKAMLLMGFAGAFRRPDLVGLRWSDITFDDAGLIVRLRQSKTDRDGRGVDVGIPRGKAHLTCPVQAAQRWRNRMAQQFGTERLPSLPCFPPLGRGGRINADPMTAEALTRMVRRRAEEAALEGHWGGRSLRAGFISSAADLDIPLETIAKQSRHATLDSLILYIRNDDPFRRNPAAQVGL